MDMHYAGAAVVYDEDFVLPVAAPGFTQHLNPDFVFSLLVDQGNILSAVLVKREKPVPFVTCIASPLLIGVQDKSGCAL